MNTNNPVNSQALIGKIVDLYSQYLSCSPEQLDLLALWTMHTHSMPAAPFSPFLNIHSRQKQSGKSLCLELLRLLCDEPEMHIAASPSLLLHQLADASHDGENEFTGTLLLDDCHATFGTRMNLKLQGLLTASFQQHGFYTVEAKGAEGYEMQQLHVFFPTAFAGHGRLPACLADRSILINLEPKPPGSPCQPFRFYDALKLARPISLDLREWGGKNYETMCAIAPYRQDQFPPGLTSRQQDCAEPLLHIADFIGGEWPQRARQALVNAFALAAFEDFYHSSQILSDLRDAFAEKGNPGWISTADLLAFLHTMEDRTWDDWSKGKPMKPKDLAGLLAPFGIHSHNHRTSPDKVIKGYNLEDFQESWNHHLPQTCDTEALGYERSAVAAQFAEVKNNQVMDSTCSVVAADTQNPSTSIPGQKPVASSQKLAASGSAVAAKSAKFTNNPAIGPLGRVAARNLRRVTSNLEWLGTKG
jgi:hypothetical protein